MNIVITMAGNGSRFKEAGYKLPKYMISVNGKTLFEWSLTSLINLNDKSKYIFIVKREDNAVSFITQYMSKLGIMKYDILEIDKPTDGQATTAMEASSIWDRNDSLLIHNIDTYIEKDFISLDMFKGDGFIPCFDAEGEHWSFVKIDDSGLAIEVREKQRISNNCTVGIYYFSTAYSYENIYSEYYSSDNILENGEKYIAPLYNHLIKKGGDVYICNIPNNKVHVLGTPKEVDSFLKKGKYF